MGMYTEIVLAAELVRDVPQQVIDTLAHMVCNDAPEPHVLPNHPLFSTPRWDCMLCCDSYYFSGDTRSTLRFDDISKSWRLTVRANLKNYDDEIAKFTDWLIPYVQDRGFLGYWRYEEDEHPTLIFTDDPASLTADGAQ